MQVRQRADHPRTLLAMEQQMLRRQSELGRAPPVQVMRTKEGLDFTFMRRQHAQRFVTLLHSLAPCRSKASQSAIANQETSRTGKQNVKYTWSVEVAPICRGDLVRVPAKSSAAGTLGGGARLALVAHVGGVVHLLDPTTGRKAEVPSEAYWRHPFPTLLGRRQLSTFVVLDMEIDDNPAAAATAGGGGARGGATRGGERSSRGSGDGEGGEAGDGEGGGGGGSVDGGSSHGRSHSTLFVQADATIARERDFGVNDVTHYVRTHLGGLLEAGDEASGYDLEAMISIDEDAESEAPQAVILVEKKRLRSKGSHAKRGSGAARRRKKRDAALGGGSSADDGASSMCSGTTYQSDFSDLDGLDALAVDMYKEGYDDEDEGDGLMPSLRGFLGEIAEGEDEEGEEGAEGEPRRADTEDGQGGKEAVALT